ncbi:MAG: phosphatidylserine decarboxylase [Planctomycetes bacterium]|nr:phosphatidylserine decarboxylase [Planctomycetota bacterium]
MDPSISSIQPGGGFCMSLELGWGRLRRAYLRRFRKGYLARMAGKRLGSAGRYPHEMLDPRDLKFFRNQGDIRWQEEDDPFAWRNRLFFVRAGLAEIIVIGGGFLALGLALLLLFWPLAPLPLLGACFTLWFFRNPARKIPTDAGLVVAPADGRVFAVREVEHDDLLGGPAVVIDIFLSVFNVHINRVPMASRVIGMTYRRGKFLSALRPEAAGENECLEVRWETTSLPRRVLRVRQITGAIARRIVCWVSPDERLPRGAQFGMIKLGSRTELTIPREPGLQLCTWEGQKVRAGVSVLARYPDERASG